MGLTKKLSVIDYTFGAILALVGAILLSAPPHRLSAQVVQPPNCVTASPVQTTTATGTQDNFSTGFTFSAGCTFTLRANNATAVTFRGFTGGVDGATLCIVSIGAGQVNIDGTSANSSSTAANREIAYVTSGVTPLAAGVGTACQTYDGTSSRWRMISHDQGAWITPAYVGANYNGNGSMTWTVDSGDVLTQKYYLRGRTLTVITVLNSTSIGGTPNSQLIVTNGVWGGFTVAAYAINPIFSSDNGSLGVNYSQANGPSSTQLLMIKTDGTNWTAAANTTNIQGQITFEVQ